MSSNFKSLMSVLHNFDVTKCTKEAWQQKRDVVRCKIDGYSVWGGLAGPDWQKEKKVLLLAIEEKDLEAELYHLDLNFSRHFHKNRAFQKRLGRKSAFDILPGELRNHIYSFIMPEISAPAVNNYLVPLSEHLFTFWTPCSIPRLPPLVRTCRTVRQECLSLVYCQPDFEIFINLLHLSSWGRCKNIVMEWMEITGEDILAQIRRFRFRLGGSTWARDPGHCVVIDISTEEVEGREKKTMVISTYKPWTRPTSVDRLDVCLEGFKKFVEGEGTMATAVSTFMEEAYGFTFFPHPKPIREERDDSDDDDW